MGIFQTIDQTLNSKPQLLQPQAEVKLSTKTSINHGFVKERIITFLTSVIEVHIPNTKNITH